MKVWVFLQGETSPMVGLTFFKFANGIYLISRIEHTVLAVLNPGIG